MTKQIDNITRHSEVSEKAIEKYLAEQASNTGWLCLKYFNPNMAGYPDRLLLIPGGKTYWVELKSKGKKPSQLQSRRMAELIAMGFPVAVIDSKEAVDELIKSNKR